MKQLIKPGMHNEIFSTCLLKLREKRKIGFWLDVEKVLSKTIGDAISFFSTDPYKIMSKTEIIKAPFFEELASMMVTNHSIYISLDAINGYAQETITAGSNWTAFEIFNNVLRLTSVLLEEKYKIYHENLSKINTKRKKSIINEIIDDNVKSTTKIPKKRVIEIKELFIDAIQLAMLLFCCQQIEYESKNNIVMLDDDEKQIILQSPSSPNKYVIQFGRNAVSGPSYTAYRIENFIKKLLRKS